MATTPKGIEYPVIGDSLTPLANHFAALADSVDDALSNVTEPGHYTGTNAQRAALTAPKLREGIFWYTTDTNLMYFYTGTTWKVIQSRPILCQVTKNIAQALASAQTITWSSSSPSIDTDGFYSTGQNTRLTIPVTGLYRVTFTLNSTSAGAVIGAANIFRNGNEYSIGKGVGFGTSGGGAAVHESIIANLTANDYIEVRTNSVTGASGAWNSSSGECVFSAEFLGQL